jgi:PleD family two-component response regulator
MEIYGSQQVDVGNMYEIMVVDDDAVQLDMVEQLLDQEGYGVLKARSARKRSPDRPRPRMCL